MWRAESAPGETVTLARVPEATCPRGGDLTAWRSRDSRRVNWNLHRRTRHQWSRFPLHLTFVRLHSINTLIEGYGAHGQAASRHQLCMHPKIYRSAPTLGITISIMLCNNLHVFILGASRV